MDQATACSVGGSVADVRMGFGPVLAARFSAFIVVAAVTIALREVVAALFAALVASATSTIGAGP